MRRRDTEISTLFKRLYEDNVLGKVTNEQFRMLSGDYNTEQKSLKERIPQTAERIEELQASISNVTQFIDKAKRYTEINELSGELLNVLTTAKADSLICCLPHPIPTVHKMSLWECA